MNLCKNVIPRPAWLFLLFVNALVVSAFAEDIRFPVDSGVFNIQTDFGAKGDGVTDDTVAIQKALLDPKIRFKVLYFPNGTYSVSDKLSLGSGKQEASAVTLQGQSQVGTIIKLKDHAEGYNDSSKSKPLFNSFEGGTTGQAFHNQIFNMTFDVGSGNPGAIGVRFMANNQGAMVDVTIRSSDPDKAGASGLACNIHEPGPTLYRRVTIEGFDIGILADHYAFSLQFEDILLKGQRKFGIQNTNQTMMFHRLISENKVPVYFGADKNAQITMVNCTFKGGDSSSIALQGPNVFVLKDVKAEGYSELIKGEGKTVSFYTNGKQFNARGESKVKPLNLPIEDPPEIPWDDPSTWVRVNIQNADDASADVQRAFDEAAAKNATTVYFPSCSEKSTTACRIAKTIRVHGSVRRILGLESNLYIINPLLDSKDPVFRLEDLSSPSILIERFWQTPWKKGNFIFVEDKSGATVILRHLMLSGGFTAKTYRKAGGPPNKVFIDDVVGHGLYFEPDQQVWMRQYNPESNMTMTVNNGAKLWALGIKIEGYGTVIETKNGGATEVYGGFLLGSWDGEQDRKARRENPAYLIDNSKAFISTTMDRNFFDTMIREVKSGRTIDLPGKSVGRQLGAYSTE